MRDFENIAAFFSDWEIEELQAAVGARHAARSGRPRQEDPATPARDAAAGPGTLERGRRAG